MDSTTPPDDVTPTAVEERVSDLGVQSEEKRVLVVKDCNPWGVAANETVLNEVGVAYDVINSSSVGGTELGRYDAVVIPSTQSGGYYANLADAKGALDAYVRDGGTLVAHVTDSGWPCTTTWNESFLPEGVGHVTNYYGNLSIAAGDSPVLSGVSDDQLDGWGFSSHGYLTDVPGDATTIVGVSGGPTGKPTYIEYEPGDGRVLATTQTLEWPYRSNSGTPRVLRNELQYALDQAPGIDFGALRDEKLALAGSITDLSPSIDETARVEPTLDAMAAALDGGDIDPSVAAEAVERMKQGENVSEFLIGGLAPATAPTPEDDDTLVGVPSGSGSYDVAGGTVDMVLDLALVLLLAALSFARLGRFAGWGRLGRIVGGAKNTLARVVDDVLNYLVGLFDDVLGDMASFTRQTRELIVNAVTESGIIGGGALGSDYAAEKSGVRDGFANYLVETFEQNVPGKAVDERLRKFDETLGPDDGGPSFDGSLSGAKGAAAGGIAATGALFDEAETTFDLISGSLLLLDFLGIVAGVLLATGIYAMFALILEIFVILMGVTATLSGIATGVYTMYRSVDIHDRTLDAVVDGTPEV